MPIIFIKYLIHIIISSTIFFKKKKTSIYCYLVTNVGRHLNTGLPAKNETSETTVRNLTTWFLDYSGGAVDDLLRSTRSPWRGVSGIWGSRIPEPGSILSRIGWPWGSHEELTDTPRAHKPIFMFRSFNYFGFKYNYLISCFYIFFLYLGCISLYKEP